MSLFCFIDSCIPLPLKVFTKELFGRKFKFFFRYFQVTVAGKQYNLYVQSYLQYGINGIKIKVAQHLFDLSPDSETVDNPCMLRGNYLICIKMFTINF